MGLDLEALKKKYKEVKDKVGGDFTFYRLSDGDNLIRLLPPWKEGVSFYKELRQHYGVGVDKKQVLCLRMKGEECPICEFVSALYQSGDPDDAEMAGNLSASTRYNFNVIARSDEAAGPQILTTGPLIFRDFLRFIVDPDWGDLTDPEQGFDITINRTGKGLHTKYAVTPKRNPSPVGNAEWLEKMTDLDKLERFVSAEDMKAILYGEGPSSEKEEKVDKSDALDRIISKKEEKKSRKPRASKEKTEIKKASPKEENGNAGKLEHPECFGVNLSSDEKCKVCSFKEDCLEKFTLAMAQEEEKEEERKRKENERKEQEEKKKEAKKAEEDSSDEEDEITKRIRLALAKRKAARSAK